MRIKLAILEQDASYLKRIVAAFNNKYSDKFEIYSFTSQEVAISTLTEAKIDVLIADDSFEIDQEKLPRRCGFAYLVESADIDTVNEQRAIFKYQKVELIYKQIISVYSDKASSVSGIRLDDDSCKVILFCSAGGGTGSSSMAAACALHYAAQEKKTLYLNLERFGSSGSFFTAEGQFTMADVVFAVKSKKANLALKLESSVRMDARGVYFFAPSDIALDMMELKAEDTIQLISELQLTGSYEYMVVDTDFGLDKDTLSIYRRAHAIVLVTDGSEIANLKTVRAVNALSILEQNADSPLMSRLALVYNKASNSASSAITEVELKTLGSASRFSQANTQQIIGALAGLPLFDKII